MKTIITIPCHWKKKILNEVVKQNLTSNDIFIAEIYGTLAKSPTGHGRSPDSVPNITSKYAINFRKKVASFGLKFTYLLNAPFSFKENENKKEVEDYIKWVIDDFKPDALTVASHELMCFIRKNYPKISINISTVAGVENLDQLKKFEDVSPKRLIVHHDANRNFKDLKKIIKEAKSHNIEVELMATESCLRRCPNRIAHYKHLPHSKPDNPFHMTCNIKKLMYPRELLKSNFIRPEDLCIYEKMGINIFKITGRSKKSNWLPEVTEAYTKRRYNGNLIRLLGIDPSLNAEEWIYINNKALNGFLDYFPQTGIEEDENRYCEKWIQKLYKKGDFVVKDGSKYKQDENGNLYCYLLGKKIGLLMPSKN